MIFKRVATVGKRLDGPWLPGDLVECCSNDVGLTVGGDD